MLNDAWAAGFQWFWDQEDEDHAAAVWFNVNGAEYVKERMKSSDNG